MREKEKKIVKWIFFLSNWDFSTYQIDNFRKHEEKSNDFLAQLKNKRKGKANSISSIELLTISIEK